MACASDVFTRGPNYQGKRRRSTEGAQGTDMGHENAEGMAHVGVRLTAQLGDGPCTLMRMLGAWLVCFNVRYRKRFLPLIDRY